MSLTITIDLPTAVESRLRSETGDLVAYAREAFAVQCFREGKLTHFDLSQVLELDRYETDTLLKRHRVEEGGLTHDDLDAERVTAGRLLGSVR